VRETGQIFIMEKLHSGLAPGCQGDVFKAEFHLHDIFSI